MFSSPKILFLVSLLFIALLNSIPILVILIVNSSPYVVYDTVWPQSLTGIKFDEMPPDYILQNMMNFDLMK